MKNEQILKQWLTKIVAPDLNVAAETSAHVDVLTKPPGSLGKLEELVIRLAGMTGKARPQFDRRAVIVMAADHGVVAEGISAFPAEVTPQMVMNFLAGGAAVNVLARHARAEVICVDIGVNADLEHANLLSRNIRKGTANMAQGAAMTREEAIQAILTGVEVVAAEVAKGTQLFVTGEMGIGNTTASAAVMSALTGIAPAAAVGRGTGLDDAGVQRKAAVVSQALSVNRPNREDALDVLCKVGGLEIAGLTGVILAAAAHRCPVVIDGFISTVAALVARQLAPLSTAYMIASHTSDENAHAALLRELELKTMLDLDMRLGEGTGGVLSLHLIDAACLILNEMATFTSAGVSDGSGEGSR
ncbi:nicotinate-nucleotide--dimethylbenzimidazole phosphoribosyltransferase [Paenibacillus barcinonensis]|uniref:Nicotinate-nucleotide--dimethylbenzimidazole phosphoribosyltransferase n=1 Tax=Paenibacillus barcinonensis TaxID=198119 RepID=A0A2V4VTC8_PAEBA|nr:nicotinate-nucleotide--dimethylbenzimidazole phosphoribosyltransferase [Paenibacillus barcinonensis]PYE45528.1 nicotinate-nucleotide-dimethylbenzimidazole phosphoribosyltransferase [Paenibacillus barcinonensis]QKS58958.1 nicotinate-nucleotide--dimethylbenzimidazole phosphoribosyltransferase [Paenibacillus barcinonensis]